jgi:hypothetical protein
MTLKKDAVKEDQREPIIIYQRVGMNEWHLLTLISIPVQSIVFVSHYQMIETKDTFEVKPQINDHHIFITKKAA